MELSDPGLETERMRLEPLNEAHREVLRQTAAVEHMWSSMPLIPHGTSFDAYFSQCLNFERDGTGLALAIFEKQGGRLVGLAAYLNVNRLHRRLRIGYIWLERELRGTGLYSAIQARLIERAIDWRARRIEWRIEDRNERALRALRGIGAVEEGTLRRYARHADGTWVNLTIFSMLNDEATAAVPMLKEAGTGW